MSVTTPQAAQPVQAAELKIEEVTPAPLKPEVVSIERDFNTAISTSKEESPAEEAQFAEKAPELAKAAQDAQTLASGGVVQPLTMFHDAVAVGKTVKAGWKTTEFWLTLGGLALTNLSVIKIPGKYGQAITDGAALSAYVLSRGIAKHGA
jgi:hypothetical protein